MTDSQGGCGWKVVRRWSVWLAQGWFGGKERERKEGQCRIWGGGCLGVGRMKVEWLKMARVGDKEWGASIMGDGLRAQGRGKRVGRQFAEGKKREGKRRLELDWWGKTVVGGMAGSRSGG
ncbi:hypothetical protein GOBAR_AA26344 [Gossypium barbadense]|uniref:Uncharacterized protein n=1 Tax=Gossypium barbadense TaxID=3634 RepID=A0A2P5WTC4_GOSBA|nr:hypothetical protein GOBAR_AA26344 [Gossypium barbadense]